MWNLIMDKKILFSIIIPTRDRLELLSRCLDRLIPGKQNFPAQRYEVIVTDDGVRMKADKLIKNRYPWVKWVNNINRGPSANRNNGSRYASGEWLIFTDDDAMPDENWLCAFSKAAQEGEYDVCEGKIVASEKTSSPFSRSTENLTGNYFAAGNLAIKKDAFIQIGRFDEDFLQQCFDDVEFAYRIRKSGLKTHFCEESIVVHPVHHMNIFAIFKRSLFIKWRILYELKTAPKIPFSANIFTVLFYRIYDRIKDLGSPSLLHEVKYDAGRRWTPFSYLVWKWVTFPIMLPYVLYWEVSFRKRLRQKER